MVNCLQLEKNSPFKAFYICGVQKLMEMNQHIEQIIYIRCIIFVKKIFEFMVYKLGKRFT